MTTNRTIQLLFYLLRHRKTTAVHLAKEFDVSLRTIYRDLDQLSQAGIPLYTTTGRNGGVSLMEDFVLDRTFFTRSEQNELTMALSSLTATGFMELDSLQEKLASLKKETKEDPFWVNFSRWGLDHTQEAELFNQLKAAILRQRVVKINYLNRHGKEGWRIIEPQKLVFQQSQWYVLGFCRQKSAFRLFRLSRVLDFQTQEETFEPKASIEKYLEQSKESYGEIKTVKLIASCEVKHRLVDTFGAAVVETVGDLVQVAVQLPIDEWMVSFCLSLGPALREIQPLQLKTEVMTAHQNALEQLRRRD